MIGEIRDGKTYLIASSNTFFSPFWVSAEHSRYLCRISALLRGYELRVAYDGTNLTALISFERWMPCG
jgi:hypothetical protein